MQPNLIAQLALFFPEMLVAIGALILLIIGSLSRKDSYKMVSRLAMAILVAAVVLLIFFPHSGTMFNDALIIDTFSCFMKSLILVNTFVVLMISVGFARTEKFDKFEFPVLMLLATFGMMLTISAGNMLSLYLGIELQSLALYVLAAINRDNLPSSEAGVKYFTLGALSSCLLLYGISLLYGYTGHINFTKIADALSEHTQTSSIALIVGIVFVLSGLSFKISAVPFHMWTPDVYEGTPTPVTAFLASAPKVAAVAFMSRVVIDAFSISTTATPGSMLASAWQQIVIFIALASMILGAFAGIGQHNIKRLMAYSSITHMGYSLVGLSAGTVVGVQSVIIYMVIYVATIVGCFTFILAMNKREGYVGNIYNLSGLVHSDPFMAVIMTVYLFSLAGVPMLAGFFGKWYAFKAAIGVGFVPLAIIGMLTSVIAAFYYARLVQLMWFDKPKSNNFHAIPIDLYLVLLLSGVFVLFYVFFGIWISPLAEKAAQSLFLSMP